MRLLSTLLVPFFLLACTTSNDNPDTESLKKDTIETTINESETIHQESLDSSSIEKYESATEVRQKEIIANKYGIQWDFCDCITKNDSIQKAIDLAGDIDDAEFDILMKRFEEIDRHCKSIITNPNRTPDERKAHERKVKKCLQKTI